MIQYTQTRIAVLRPPGVSDSDWEIVQDAIARFGYLLNQPQYRNRWIDWQVFSQLILLTSRDEGAIEIANTLDALAELPCPCCGK